ncbi:MAG: hypothetical protein QW334_02080 [Thermofilum sp.]
MQEQKRVICCWVTTRDTFLNDPHYLDRVKDNEKVIIPKYVIEGLTRLVEKSDPLHSDRAALALEQINRKIESGMNIEIYDPEGAKRIVDGFAILIPFAIVSVLLGFAVHLAFLPFGIIGLIIAGIVRYCHSNDFVLRAPKTEQALPLKFHKPEVPERMDDYTILMTEPIGSMYWEWAARATNNDE